MSDTLVDVAMERFYDRKDAAAGVRGGEPAPGDAPLVLAGLGIDLTALNVRAHQLAHSVEMTRALSGEPLCKVLTDALVSAFAMGALHERERAERDRVHADA